jgi:hypothetical protein
MRIYNVTVDSSYIGREEFLSKSAISIIKKIQDAADFFGRKIDKLPIRRGLENMKNEDTITCTAQTDGGTIVYTITVMDYPEF